MLIPAVKAHIDAAVLAIAASTTSAARSSAHSINTAEEDLIGNITVPEEPMSREEEEVHLEG